MTRVTVYKSVVDGFKGFLVSGHAGYEDHGKDVVCAAVSILVINTINAIEAFTSDEMSCHLDQVAGVIECQFKHEPSKQATLLLDTMMLGLESIQADRQYSEFIELIFQEV